MRKHLSKSGAELQQLFESSKRDLAVLQELVQELRHRSTASARTLRKKAEAALADVKSKSPSHDGKEQSSGTWTQTVLPEFHAVACRGCKVSLEVENCTERTEYTCPDCGAEFEAVFKEGVLQVTWLETVILGTELGEMTESTARALLGLEANASFAAIKAAWNATRLQLHPEKNQRLPERLRLAVESELKRLDEAYEILERATAADF